MAVPDDSFRGLSRSIKIRIGIREPGQAGVRIGDDRHERLAHFVGDQGRELTHRRQPRRACEMRLSVGRRMEGCVVAAKFQREALQRARCVRHDAFARRGRSGEGHLRHVVWLGPAPYNRYQIYQIN